MKEWFEDWKPTAETRKLLSLCEEIIGEYQADGYALSVRQLYYQLVVRDLIPNEVKEYDRIKRILGRGRLAGMIDWDMIEDRNRSVRELATWVDGRDRLLSAARTFRLDKWKDQPHRLIVMCEKAALEGVLLPVCQRHQVPFTANRGYTSLSHIYGISKQLFNYYEYDDQEPIVLYFGDHDPSGLDMDRDIRERVSLLSGERFEIERLALTAGQIDEYQPPPNPAKTTDSRAKWYIAEFGDESWELDALAPDVLDDLVSEAIVQYRDDDLWDAVLDRETEMRNRIHKLGLDWEAENE